MPEKETYSKEEINAMLVPINTKLDNINTGLFNHINHLTDKLNTIEKNYISVGKDIEWIKKLFDPKGEARIEIKSEAENAKQSANIEWLKWGLMLLLSGLVSAAISIFSK